MALCQDLPHGQRHEAIHGGYYANKRKPTNLPASIRQRLLSLSRDRSEFPQAAPTAFTEEFAGNPDKGMQWNAFLSRNRLDAGGMVLTQSIQEIRLFLMPPMLDLANGQEFEETWPAGGPWVSKR